MWKKYICGRKKWPPVRSKHYSTVFIKQKHYVNTFLARRTFADAQWSQIPKAEVQEGQWFLLTVVWFSQQRQEGNKGLLPGHKPTQVQTHPRGREERRGSEARAKQPFLHWAVISNLGRSLTSYVTELTEKPAPSTLHWTPCAAVKHYSVLTAHGRQLGWWSFMLFITVFKKLNG